MGPGAPVESEKNNLYTQVNKLREVTEIRALNFSEDRVRMDDFTGCAPE